LLLAQEGGVGIVHKDMTSPRSRAGGPRETLRERRGQGSDSHFSAEMTVRDVLVLTRQHKISGLPVVDNGLVVGIISDRDLRF